MTVKNLLIYSSDFIASTGRVRIRFYTSRSREKNIVLKLLLKTRAKTQYEIKIQNVNLQGFAQITAL